MHLAESVSLITHVVSLNNWFICLRAASSLNLASSFASPTVRLWLLNVIIASSHLCLIVHTWDFVGYFKDAPSLCSCTLVVILSSFANAFTLVGRCRGEEEADEETVSLHCNTLIVSVTVSIEICQSLSRLSQRGKGSCGWRPWMGKSLWVCFSSLTETCTNSHLQFSTSLH